MLVLQLWVVEYLEPWHYILNNELIKLYWLNYNEILFSGDQRPRGQQFHSNPSNNKTPVSPNEARFVPLQAIRAQQRKRENQQIPSDAQNPLIPVEAAPSCAPISLAAAATTQFNPTPSTSPPSNPQTTESSSHQGNIPVKNSQSPKNKSSSNNSTQPNVVRKRRPRIAANFSQKFVD